MNQGKWRTAHASVTGAAHAAQNVACQDRFSCRAIDTATGEILIAAVADGAGSTTSGERGAEIACALFVEQIENFLISAHGSIESLTEDFGKLWVNFAQQKIAAAAAEENKSPREFASTFLGAVAGESSAAFFQIGDGAIVYSIRGAAGTYEFGIEPAEAEYVNMTDFITDAAAAERLRFKFVTDAIEDLAVFSDGIFAVAVDYKTAQPHAPFLTPMLAPLRNNIGAAGLNEKLEKFLATPQINEKTDDDKTIILASRFGVETAKISA